MFKDLTEKRPFAVAFESSRQGGASSEVGGTAFPGLADGFERTGRHPVFCKFANVDTLQEVGTRERWIGRLLTKAFERFDERVLQYPLDTKELGPQAVAIGRCFTG